ncbi:hypothetical protein [Butyrivibrio sp. NC2007]|uniref:hypothetical protein n=1 Tax=Butyrivibrio sp. NC2007 TaxID=1280683 RepID=UPI0003B42E55|nr:hypothetical protein [Butyrivibrio sp. NC2007]
MNNKLRGRDYAFLLCIIVIVIALVFRCFYGLGLTFSDEFAQPAAVKRYLSGDRLFIDDWHTPTMMLGFVISRIVGFLPINGISVIQLRMIYVCFQFAIAGILLFAMGWKDSCSRVCVLAYLLSTPYGIMSNSYNTVSIGGFLVFLTLFLKKDKKTTDVLAGVSLAFAAVSIPYVAGIYFLYVFVTIVMLIKRKENKLFCLKRLLWLSLGIMILFIPFCVNILTRGSFQEYTGNIGYILNDAEHNEGLLFKLIRSQYQIIRIYWRAWLPLAFIDIIIVAKKKLSDAGMKKGLAYMLTSAAIIYTTLRFAFVYGSVSINLMIVPMFFWGLETVILLVIWKIPLKDYSDEIIWLIAGFLFALCDYLATNTEMLSMSAMFIVSALAAIQINIRFYQKELLHEHFIQSIIPKITIAVFLLSLFILRMTFIWGDEGITELNTRITSGIAKGIYTTGDNANEYYRLCNIIRDAAIDEKESVLILPMSPFLYMVSDGVVAAPYVARFEADVNELRSYYDIHDYKLPDKVVAIKDLEDNEALSKIIDYFTAMNYHYEVNDDEKCILHR